MFKERIKINIRALLRVHDIGCPFCTHTQIWGHRMKKELLNKLNIINEKKTKKYKVYMRPTAIYGPHLRVNLNIPITQEEVERKISLHRILEFL
jgi:hypothetical protein